MEIHRKPGYDPVELFLDPAIRFPRLAVGWRLARRALGFATLMNVIPLDATLVKGSHGRPTDDPSDGPLLVSSEPRFLPDGPVAATLCEFGCDFESVQRVSGVAAGICGNGVESFFVGFDA